MSAKRVLTVKLVGDERDLSRTLRNAGRDADGFSTKLTAAGKRAGIALAGIGLGAIGAGAKMVDLAGDATEVDSKFNIVFGQNVPRLTKNLDAFSEATGASRYELKQQTADMGALLSPILQNADATAGLSEEMVKLAVDLGSFNNIPVAEALEKIRAGLVGEAEPLRSVGVLLSEASTKQEAYRSGIAKTGAELTEQQKVQARANQILEQTKLAHGDATKTADSYSNQMKRLRNELVDTGTDIGKIMLPAVTRVVQEMNDAIPAVIDWAGSLADDLKPELDNLADWARDHKDEFSNMFEDATGHAKTLASALGKGAKGTDGVVSAMGGWDDAFTLLLTGVLASKMQTLARRAGGLAGVLSKIKGLGPTIALTIAIEAILDDRSEGFLDAIENQLRRKLRLSGLLGDARNQDSILDIGPDQPAKVSGESASDKAGAGGAGTGTVALAGNAKASPPKPHVIKMVKKISRVYGGALTIYSGTRHGATTGRGRPSSHATGDAADISTSPGAHNFAVGRAALIAMGMDPKKARAAGGGYHNFPNGQVIFGISDADGDHTNHVHLTYRGGGTDTDDDTTTTVESDDTTTTTGASAKSKPPLIPLRMQEALAKAEGTQTVDDDLTALMVVAKYLDGLIPKTGDIEKRIELREALNQIRERIADINQTAGEKQKQLDAAELVKFDTLKEKLRDAFADAIERARERLVAARDGFGSAFSVIGDKLTQVFDAKTEQLLAKARARVERFGFTIGAGEETPAEVALREYREKRQADDLVRRRAAADAKLAAAETEQDRAAALASQAALDEEATEARLVAAATAERQAADEALAAERQRIQDERAVKKEGFAAELADLEEHWATTSATVEQRTAELQALMAKYETPFESVGTLLGASFASGLLSQLQSVFDRLEELRNAVSAVSPAMAAEAAHTAATAAGKTRAEAALAARSAGLNALYGLPVPGFADGVTNFAGGLALVGERGPELLRLPRGSDVIPNGHMGRALSGAGLSVYVTITGPVLGRSPEVARELARLIEPELGRRVGFSS